MVEIRRDIIVKHISPWWNFGILRAGMISLFYTCPAGHVNDLDPDSVDKSTGETKTVHKCVRFGDSGCKLQDRIRLVGWGGPVKIV